MQDFFFLICILFSRAVGHKVFGSLYQEKILEKLRKSAEHCDCLQCFFIIHSMGGGKIIQSFVYYSVKMQVGIHFANISGLYFKKIEPLRIKSMFMSACT